MAKILSSIKKALLPIVSTLISMASGIALLIADAVGACGDVCMAPPSDAQRFAGAILIGGPLILWGLRGRLRASMRGPTPMIYYAGAFHEEAEAERIRELQEEAIRQALLEEYEFEYRTTVCPHEEEGAFFEEEEDGA